MGIGDVVDGDKNEFKFEFTGWPDTKSLYPLDAAVEKSASCLGSNVIELMSKISSVEPGPVRRLPLLVIPWTLLFDANVS